MRVVISPHNRTVRVERDLLDPVFGKDESWFLHKVKKQLQSMGYDCIKKLAAKDGNLVDDHMHYIRDRKNRWYIYDNQYATRCVSKEFDTLGFVYLSISEGLCK